MSIWKRTDDIGWVHDPALYEAVDDSQNDADWLGCTNLDEGFFCLRSDLHLGRHVALSTDAIVAAWPGDHRPTMADLR